MNREKKERSLKWKKYKLFPSRNSESWFTQFENPKIWQSSQGFSQPREHVFNLWICYFNFPHRFISFFAFIFKHFSSFSCLFHFSFKGPVVFSNKQTWYWSSGKPLLMRDKISLFLSPRKREEEEDVPRVFIPDTFANFAKGLQLAKEVLRHQTWKNMKRKKERENV